MIDYASLPLPKPVRLRDPAALQRARDRGYCEHCGRRCMPDPHHIRSRGAGGPDTDDNLISLCPKCHDKAHWALISRDTLRRIIDAR